MRLRRSCGFGTVEHLRLGEIRTRLTQDLIRPPQLPELGALTRRQALVPLGLPQRLRPTAEPLHDRTALPPTQNGAPPSMLQHQPDSTLPHLRPRSAPSGLLRQPDRPVPGHSRPRDRAPRAGERWTRNSRSRVLGLLTAGAAAPPRRPQRYVRQCPLAADRPLTLGRCAKMAAAGAGGSGSSHGGDREGSNDSPDGRSGS